MRPEPCTDEAREHGCTCRLISQGGNDPDAYVQISEWCPVHGRDPDAALERQRDDEWNRLDQEIFDYAD
jgi:hypothetical protein